jgi:hypothetical protein
VVGAAVVMANDFVVEVGLPVRAVAMAAAAEAVKYVMA